MSKPWEKSEAVRLRKDERLSEKEIAVRLGVSKGAVSRWVRDCPLSKEEIKLRLIKSGSTPKPANWIWVHRDTDGGIDRCKVHVHEIPDYVDRGFKLGLGKLPALRRPKTEAEKLACKVPHLFNPKLLVYGYGEEEQRKLRTSGYRFCGWHKKFESEGEFGKKKKFCRLGCREENKKRYEIYGAAVKNPALRGLYENLLFKQEGHCALCPATTGSRANPRLCFDHDHSCCPTVKHCAKCVRGLLCNACNYQIGKLEDLLRKGLMIDRTKSWGWGLAAINYLEIHGNAL